MENEPASPAPVHRLVGPFSVLCSLEFPFPDRDKLVIVEAINGDVFIARFDVQGEIMPWPYWVVSDTQYRRANPLDLWAYYPQTNTWPSLDAEKYNAAIYTETQRTLLDLFRRRYEWDGHRHPDGSHGYNAAVLMETQQAIDALLPNPPPSPAAEVKP